MRIGVDKDKELWQKILAAILIVGGLHLVFSLVAGKSLFAENPYNTYSRQCVAWLSGRLDLPENYSWLEIAIYGGKYYASFPPFPSYILLPFAAIFGVTTPDSIIAFFVMEIGVIYAVKIAHSQKLSFNTSVLLPVFLYCGTAVWQITVDGWIWFLAQSMALTLSLMSLYYALKGNKGLAALFIVCAAGCRPFQLIYLPVGILILLMGHEGTVAKRFKSLFLTKFYVYLPAIFIGMSYMVLNYFRFGSVIEFGHNYLPEHTESLRGQFSLEYLPNNLKKLFRLPQMVDGALSFSGFGELNIFIAFPIFLMFLGVFGFCLYKVISGKEAVKNLAITINCLILPLSLLHILALAMHVSMGGSHFGNRYIGDVLPAIYTGLCLLIGSRAKTIESSKIFIVCLWGLMLFGFMLCTIGVYGYYNQ